MSPGTRQELLVAATKLATKAHDISQECHNDEVSILAEAVKDLANLLYTTVRQVERFKLGEN